MKRFTSARLLLALFSSSVIVLQAQSQAISSGSTSVTRDGVARFEVGIQYTNRGLGARRNSDGSFSSPPGRAVGPSLAVNINRNFAVDAILSQTPGYENNPDNLPDGSAAGGRSLEVLVGPRLEARRGGLGVFVAGRGGVLNWSHVLQDETLTSPYLPIGTLRYGAGYYPVFEGVAGIEYALTPRFRLRGEIGDQIIGNHSQTIELFQMASQQTSTWTYNTAVTRIGIFASVGPVAGRPSDRFESDADHRFFDRTNIILLTVSVLSQTADLVASKRAQDAGQVETNGLARPFYQNGAGGILGLSVIINSIQVGFMYGLHKTGHRKLERIPPLAVIGGTIHGAYVSSEN